jgi:hypothetical protein
MRSASLLSTHRPSTTLFTMIDPCGFDASVARRGQLVQNFLANDEMVQGPGTLLTSQTASPYLGTHWFTLEPPQQQQQHNKTNKQPNYPYSHIVQDESTRLRSPRCCCCWYIDPHFAPVLSRESLPRKCKITLPLGQEEWVVL